MDLFQAVDLLDEYSNNADDFDPGLMLLGIPQVDLVQQVIESEIAEAHLTEPALNLKHLVVDAICHGIAIGAVMAKDDKEET